MSEYADAVRAMLEPDLFCKCGAVNSPTLRTIRVDVNGVACCANCGRGGPYLIFQPPKKEN